MFAIVTIKGVQYKIKEGEKLKVSSFTEKEGENLHFSDVMVLSNGDDVKIGTPYIEGATVEAKVISHGRGEKIRVVKFKRRKRYKKVQGHRQNFTEIEIVSVGGKSKKVKKEEKAMEEVVA